MGYLFQGHQNNIHEAAKRDDKHSNTTKCGRTM